MIKDKMKYILNIVLLAGIAVCMSFAFQKKVVRVFLIGDSTVADYSLENDFQSKRYPVTGWGQVFQQFLISDSLRYLHNIIKADSAIVNDRAKGGRSTRTFLA